MRDLLLGMWGITIARAPGGALQVLPYNSGREAVAKLWRRFALAWILVFGPLLLARAFPLTWRMPLALIACPFLCAPFFSGLNVYLFYALPGIRLDEAGLLVKDSGAVDYAFRPYHECVRICIRTSVGKRRSTHRLELFFADGHRWCTAKWPGSSASHLTQLADLIGQECGCTVTSLAQAGDG